MGTIYSKPSEALFSKTLQRVLSLLFANPDRSFYANEIVRAAGVGVGSVQRELHCLASAGLVTISVVGNQKHYRADPDSPIYEELKAIAVKVLSPAGSGRPRKVAAPVLRQPKTSYVAGSAGGALTIPSRKIAALCRRYGVKKLSLFGSAARDELLPESDIDLMVEFGPASKVSLWDMPKVQAEFSALFGHRPVELVPPEIMKNPFRRKAILADLRVLYEA